MNKERTTTIAELSRSRSRGQVGCQKLWKQEGENGSAEVKRSIKGYNGNEVRHDTVAQVRLRVLIRVCHDPI